jgi:hypothetical protein
VFFLLAQEDNSITEIGNNVMRSNYDMLDAPAVLAEIADAGHWSFTDIAGLTEDVMPGCGMDERQTKPGESFTYLDNALARRIAAHYAERFFTGALLDDADAFTEAGLAVGPEGIVDVIERHE